MARLWTLIQHEAESINEYLMAIDHLVAISDDKVPGDNDVIVECLRQIVADERDHLNALKYLYDSMTKEKPANDTSEQARKSLADYREAKKIIK